MDRPDANQPNCAATISFGRGWLRLKFLAIGAGLILMGGLGILGVRDHSHGLAMRQLVTLVAVWSVLILGLFILGREIFGFFRPARPC